MNIANFITIPHMPVNYKTDTSESKFWELLTIRKECGSEFHSLAARYEIGVELWEWSVTKHKSKNAVFARLK